MIDAQAVLDAFSDTVVSLSQGGVSATRFERRRLEAERRGHLKVREMLLDRKRVVELAAENRALEAENRKLLEEVLRLEAANACPVAAPTAQPLPAKFVSPWCGEVAAATSGRSLTENYMLSI